MDEKTQIIYKNLLNKYVSAGNDLERPPIRNELFEALGGLEPIIEKSWIKQKFKNRLWNFIDKHKEFKKIYYDKCEFDSECFEAFCYAVERWKPKENYSVHTHLTAYMDYYLLNLNRKMKEEGYNLYSLEDVSSDDYFKKVIVSAEPSLLTEYLVAVMMDCGSPTAEIGVCFLIPGQEFKTESGVILQSGIKHDSPELENWSMRNSNRFYKIIRIVRKYSKKYLGINKII